MLHSIWSFYIFKIKLCLFWITKNQNHQVVGPEPSGEQTDAYDLKTVYKMTTNYENSFNLNISECFLGSGSDDTWEM